LIAAQLAAAGSAGTSALQVQSPAVVPAASQADCDATAALHAASWSVTVHQGDVKESHVHEPAASQSVWSVVTAAHAATGVVVQLAARKAVVDPTAVNVHSGPAASHVD